MKNVLIIGALLALSACGGDNNPVDGPTPAPIDNSAVNPCTPEGVTDPEAAACPDPNPTIDPNPRPKGPPYEPEMPVDNPK